jgi:hypothetical protein
MTPISPVIPGDYREDTIFAKDQPEYIPLPAYRVGDSRGTVVTRWHVSLRERIRILIFGDIWLTMLTFYQPLQPVKLDVRCPVSLPEEDEELDFPSRPWPVEFE